jgi:hypothetical protein
VWAWTHQARSATLPLITESARTPSYPASPSCCAIASTRCSGCPRRP